MGKTYLTRNELRQFPTIKYLLELKESDQPAGKFFVKRAGDEISFGCAGLGWLFTMKIGDILEDADKTFPPGWDPAKVIVFYAAAIGAPGNTLIQETCLFEVDSDECTLQTVPITWLGEEMAKPHKREGGDIYECSAVVHQVRIADLKELALLWEISEGNLGLDVKAGELIPICLDDNTRSEIPSLKFILEKAEERYFDPFSTPEQKDLNLILHVFPPENGDEAPNFFLTTVDAAAWWPAYPTRWWTFAGGFRDKLN